MVSHSLVLKAVLLFATTVALTEALSPVKSSSGERHFRPFCHCPYGFVPRWFWHYCKCYKFVVRDLASWAEAKVYCGVMRASMVEVKDSSTHFFLRWQLFLLRLVNHHHLLEKQEYWLGATDLEVEGRFKWDTSNSLVESPTYWMNGNGIPAQEPNNYLGYQNCMALKRRPYTSNNTYYYDWIDDDCYKKKFYICERRGYFCWGWQCFRQLAKTKYTKVDLPKDMTAAKIAKLEPGLKREPAVAAAQPIRKENPPWSQPGVN